MMKKLFAVLTALFLLCACLPLGAVSVSAATFGDLTYEIADGKVTITDCDENVTSVKIPSTIEGYPVTTIGDAAFKNCKSLTSVTIPDSVTAIGHYAFYGCKSLTSVIIPDSITEIGQFAFWYCISLTSVTIPDSVTYIWEYAFGRCESLTSITVDKNNPNYCSVDGVLFNKGKTTLIQYPGGKSGAYTIPDSVTTIGEDAFSYCASLKSVTIPDSVTTIGDDAFYWCDSLTDVYYTGDETDRAAIQIGDGNDVLDTATWHYEYKIEEKEKDNDKNGLDWWVWVIIAALLAVIAVPLFLLKKKKSAE